MRVTLRDARDMGSLRNSTQYTWRVTRCRGESTCVGSVLLPAPLSASGSTRSSSTGSIVSSVSSVPSGSFVHHPSSRSVSKLARSASSSCVAGITQHAAMWRHAAKNEEREESTRRGEYEKSARQRAGTRYARGVGSGPFDERLTESRAFRVISSACERCFATWESSSVRSARARLIACTAPLSKRRRPYSERGRGGEGGGQLDT
eukprot:5085951-Prymnesium_polylepis.1